MTEEDKNVEKIGKGIISYFEFKKDFNTIKEDFIINNESKEKEENGQENNDIFIFREFNKECYIIDKEHFDEFKKAVNFEELTKILEPLTEANKDKFMKELKEYLQKNPYLPKVDNIKIYSEIEEMKELVNQFSKFSFVNKKLLCDAMSIPLIKLENKQLKVSKNKNSTCIMSFSNNYTLVIQTKKDEVSEFKNLYYVEDLTKKIFILLYFNEKIIQNKLKKRIKDIYNFEKYYLINNNWITEYKKFFLYDFVIKKFKESYNNYKDEFSEENLDSEDNDFVTSYKKTIFNLKEIIKDMGQITLYSDTIVDNEIRNAKNLIPDIKKTLIKSQVKSKNDYEQETIEPELTDIYINIPSDFYLIDDNILNLLEKEEFFINFDNELKNSIESQVLIGNENIILRNIPYCGIDENYINLNEYLIYVDKKDRMKYLADEDSKNIQRFILYYVLYYNTNKSFINDLKILNKKNGLKEYITKNNIDLNNIKIEENIKDNKGNYIGFFINIRINEEYINIENNENNENNENKEKEYFDNIIKNNKDNENEKNYISYDIINEINLDYIHYNNNMNSIDIDINEFNNGSEINESLNQNNDITISNDFNNIEEIKNGNIIINEENIEDIVQFIINYFKKHKISNDIQRLFEDINNNDLRLDIDIPFLSPEEVKKKIHSNTNEILLITEDNLKELKSFISYDIIYEYFKLKKDDRKKHLKQYVKEFYNFCLFYQNKSISSPNFSLIKNYEDCINNIDKENKFYIIYRSNKIIKKILIKKEIENIYYFTYKSHSYIYFEHKKKMFQLKFEKYYWKLIEYDNKKNINVLEGILDNTEKNVLKNNLEKYLEYANFKRFYLINEKWLLSKRHKNKKKYKYEAILFKPEIKMTGFKYKYPINFRFMENNEELINQLLLDDKTIDNNDIYLTTMFFVNDKRNNPKKIYFGILENNSNVIYFYKFEKSVYKVQFLIEYTNEDLLYEEIKDNILVKGIEAYLYEMRINIKQKAKQNLINNDLEKIGIILNLNVNNNIEFIIPEYSSKLDFINDSYFYVNVIQCLANIEPLKDIFLNRSKLLIKKIVRENRNITFHFYKLMELIWFNSSYNKNIDEAEIQSEIFLVEIREKFAEEEEVEKKSILQNIKLLIELILLSMHCEQQINNNNILEYNKIKLKDNMHQRTKTFISDIFFFELILKCCSENCSTNCILSVDIDNLDIKKIESVDIETILSQARIDLQCDHCKKKKLSNIKFKTYPKILIIAFQQKKNYNIKFNYTEQIDIDNNKSFLEYGNDNSKYEMISIITKNDNDANVVTYCKSSIHKNNWHVYKKDLGTNKQKPKEIYIFNDIKLLSNIPYILVYQQINK